MTNKNYVIRNITRDDMEFALDWAAGEGWNLGQHDGDCFYSTDPEGFFMGWLDNEPL